MSITAGEGRRWTLAEIAERVGGQPAGDCFKSVTHVAELTEACEDSISYCSGERHEQYLQITKAGIVILPNHNSLEFKGAKLKVANPRATFARVVELLHDVPLIDPGVHETAIVASSSPIPGSTQVQANVVIGRNVSIGDFVVLGYGTVIGDDVSIDSGTRVASNVTIYRKSMIGSNCRISSGVVIGSPGHSYEWNKKEWVRIPNIGHVIIGDNVDIGAGTSIDRGSISVTKIGNGVKIDNNVQIAHNVEIGDHCMIVGNVGIAGSVKIGKRCTLGGQAGVIDNVRITDDVVIQAASLVSKSISSPGIYSSTIPAREANVWKRTLAKLNKQNSVDDSK